MIGIRVRFSGGGSLVFRGGGEKGESSSLGCVSNAWCRVVFWFSLTLRGVHGMIQPFV